MDESIGQVSSGHTEKFEAADSTVETLTQLIRMIDVAPKDVNQEFAHLGPQNPLNKLNTFEKSILLALLVVHTVSQHPNSTMDKFDRLNRVAIDAGTLAIRIGAELDSGTIEFLYQELAESVRKLRDRLQAFSELAPYLARFGKLGHKQRSISTSFLVLASEFVRLKTGGYNDEHLAELFQGMGEDEDLTDFSGDAIRKRREHLKKDYPQLYASQLSSARSLCGAARNSS